MKNVWVLSVKTSLPDVCETMNDIKTEIFSFENFDDAKKSLRKKLKDLAFSKNAMFDGKGNMIYFKDYLEDAWEPEEEDGVMGNFLTKSALDTIYQAIMGIFEGKAYDVSEFEQLCYEDGMIAVEILDGTMNLCGECDGPINGYDPKIYTNMFDMSEIKDYFLYVDDRFGQDDATSELYVDLKKVQLQ